MIALNYSQFRENMKSYLDMVSNDYETLTVTRKGGNVVVLSEESYNNLLENLYVMGNKAEYDWIMESRAQLEKGQAKIRSLMEDEDE